MATWGTVPSFTTGQVVTAAELGTISTDINAFLFSALVVDEIDGSATGVGTGYPGFRAKVGKTTQSLSSGACTITFAITFPSSIFGVWISPIGANASTSAAQWVISAQSVSAFTVVFWEVGVTTQPGSTAFSYMVIGQ